MLYIELKFRFLNNLPKVLRKITPGTHPKFSPEFPLYTKKKSNGIILNSGFIYLYEHEIIATLTTGYNFFSTGHKLSKFYRVRF